MGVGFLGISPSHFSNTFGERKNLLPLTKKTLASSVFEGKYFEMYFSFL